jgi:hypothetical protein
MLQCFFYAVHSAANGSRMIQQNASQDIKQLRHQLLQINLNMLIF